MESLLPFVSVIIATYRREEVLCNTLKNILNQEYANNEIIVVDQTPQHLPATEKFLKELTDGKKILMVRRHEPSLTAARNSGIRKAKGSIIIFIDDDVKVGPRFIAEHVKNYTDKNIAGVAGKVNPEPPTKYPDASKCKDQVKDWWYLTFKLEKSGPIATMLGCNMSFRKKVLEEIGYFDENYIKDACREESDVCFRLREKGYTITFDPSAELTHFTFPEGGTREFKKDITLSPTFYRNQFYFLFKNIPRKQFRKYFMLSYRYFVCREKTTILKNADTFKRFLQRNLAFINGFFQGRAAYRKFRKNSATSFTALPR